MKLLTNNVISCICPTCRVTKFFFLKPDKLDLINFSISTDKYLSREFFGHTINIIRSIIQWI